MTPPSSTAQGDTQQLQAVTLLVSGMKCAGCVRAVENQLKQYPGVTDATVNLVTQKATVVMDCSQSPPASLAQKLTDSGFDTQVVPETQGRSPGPESSAFSLATLIQDLTLRQLLFAVLLVLGSALGHVESWLPIPIPGITSMGFHWGLATLALLGPGRLMLWDGWQGLRRNAPNMNTLVGLGCLTSYGASVVALVWPQFGWECFFDAPVMIVGLILLGRTLEEQARIKANRSFRSLLSLQTPMAYRVTAEAGDAQVSSHPPELISVEQVQPGDRLQVLPGDLFPVDGVLRAGETVVDESMLTGESVPQLKRPGDEVTAGTLNQGDRVQIEARRTGAETTLAKIIQLVETAQTRKAPIQRLADTVAGYFTYGVMAIATATFLFWSLVGARLWPAVLPSEAETLHGTLGHLAAQPSSSALLLGVKLAIAVLVIACPCALGLATPTAILVGTSLGAEQGLLLRGGDVLERTHQLDVVAFDKTGTLTYGQPQIQQIWLTEGSAIEDETQMLAWVAALEQSSRHPFATAILTYAQSCAMAIPDLDSLEIKTGLGLEGQFQGQAIGIGSWRWLSEAGILLTDCDHQRAQALMDEGCSVIFCVQDQTCVGAIALRDRVREDVQATLDKLQDMGLQTLVLTGDRRVNTQALLQELALPETAILAELSPAQKAEKIAALQAQGQRVAMIGDGINDAPALAQADVGIALSSGTDAAIETAQIVLMRSQLKAGEIDLGDVVQAIQLGRMTFQKIKQNLFWAFSYNTLGIPIAAGLLLPVFHQALSPSAAAALMACSSVSVISNSLLLRRQFR
ncbi:heavy metal translocating P-type ATPase [Lyngbya confervoides]|uniref:Cation-translocating P-type ATPase n=1 Tax=Lyngbya confervoides BDU141951 TaxID=1574623 RepID=A0ABD4T2G0_9CYAN|nr:cation-translocating P-type ATPase [Lyngbya confervoides]MCM1982714.1 cation-translocating P-type ATPase [Lyngbya confervoides BDU141951]